MRFMQEMEALRALNALAQPTRLRVLVLLAGARDEGMSPSDMADAIGIPRNLMSAHLAVLSKAGVVTSQRSGRDVTYVASRATLRELGDFLGELATG